MKLTTLLFSAAASLCLALPATSQAEPNREAPAGHAQSHGGAQPQAHATPARSSGAGRSGGAMRLASPGAHRAGGGGRTGHAPSSGGSAAGRGMASARTHAAPVQAARGPAAGSRVQSASVNALRRNVQATHQYHVAAYQPPQGYAARRWGYGDNLPGAYYARNYWITDYLAYSLFAPPDGLVWVRVGDDALLIDENSGEVIQVEYGVFD